jgi:hypothetical protein
MIDFEPQAGAWGYRLPSASRASYEARRSPDHFAPNAADENGEMQSGIARIPILFAADANEKDGAGRATWIAVAASQTAEPALTTRVEWQAARSRLVWWPEQRLSPSERTMLQAQPRLLAHCLWPWAGQDAAELHSRPDELACHRAAFRAASEVQAYQSLRRVQRRR